MEVAKELEVECIDLWTEMHHLKPNVEDRKSYLNDGLHLSAEGNTLLQQMLKKLIEACLLLLLVASLLCCFILVGVGTIVLY